MRRWEEIDPRNIIIGASFIKVSKYCSSFVYSSSRKKNNGLIKMIYARNLPDTFLVSSSDVLHVINHVSVCHV